MITDGSINETDPQNLILLVGKPHTIILACDILNSFGILEAVKQDGLEAFVVEDTGFVRPADKESEI